MSEAEQAEDKAERTESPRGEKEEGKPKTLQQMTGEMREEAKRKKAEGVPFLQQLVDEGQEALTDSQKAIYERTKTSEQTPYQGPKTRSFTLRPLATTRSGSIDASASSADTTKSYARSSSWDADSILGGTSGISGAKRFSGHGNGAGISISRLNCAGSSDWLSSNKYESGGIGVTGGGISFGSGAGSGGGITLSAQQPDLLSSITQSIGGENNA